MDEQEHSYVWRWSNKWRGVTIWCTMAAMKIISATIAQKSIKGVFPYDFTYEDGQHGIYLPENQMSYKGEFRKAQEVFEEVTGVVATKPISG